MVGFDKSFDEFLDDELTDDKILSFAHDVPHKVKDGSNFLLRCEGKTTAKGGVQCYNLQIRTVSSPPNSTVAEARHSQNTPTVTAAIVLIEIGAEPTAAELRAAFKESYNVPGPAIKITLRKK